MPSPPPESDSHARTRDGRDDKDRSHRSHSHRHHRSSRDHERRKRTRDEPERERDRGDRDRERDSHRSSRRHKRVHREREKKDVEVDVDEGEAEGEWVEAEAPGAAAELETTAAATTPVAPPAQRDSWMLAPPSSADTYTTRAARKSSPPSKTLAAAHADYKPVIHEKELNTQLRAGKALDEYADADPASEAAYEFGDSGSKWRVAKVRRVYEQAEESGRSVDEIALERYGSLKAWDDAREEETEMERRELYGVAKTKPTGELWAARQREAEKRQEVVAARQEREAAMAPPPVQQQQQEAKPLDATAINKLRAALLKAQIRGDSRAPELEREYNAAVAASKAASSAPAPTDPAASSTVVLTAMDHRALAGLSTRIGTSALETPKGKLIENADMSISDMVREEKRTRGGPGEGRQLAERIARDAKFTDNLDYLDENAAKLATRIQRRDIDIKNTAIADFSRISRTLDACALCSHDEHAQGPAAPVVSLGTRVYLTLPPEPQVGAAGVSGAVIVPLQHHRSMLAADDDEWEEVRNFMKALTRHYDALGLGVVFTESHSAFPGQHAHARILATPLPLHLAEGAPAYFKEAILAADEEWSQHKPIIDTRGRGRQGFRGALVAEMPYFHVWFGLDGGFAHVVEDAGRWPRGERFVREVVGGMVGAEETVVRREGRWQRGEGSGKGGRVERFREKWHAWDWTKVLYDAE
ncbi:CwfJ C-terminus 2-domain-containing protein-like protein [Geopyxis carbonaria]|nr:CwfJ C-terminus 2-domain-containing protein-like protein [Geopyxis carbonaria]